MKRFYLLLVRLVSVARSWFWAVMRRNHLEAEMEAELANHLESLTADLVHAGYSPSEAARRARIALGSTVAHKDEMRASLGLRFWDELRADISYGVRRLRRSVGFTLVAAISLALAIGANTAIFSMARQLLYERLHVPHAAELRLLSWTGTEEHVAVHSIMGDYDHLPHGRVTSTAFSYPAYQQLRAQKQLFEDIFAFKDTRMNATIRGNAQLVEVEMVSGNYYGALPILPRLGRAIGPSDDGAPGQGAVAVISYSLWEREFANSPAALGQVLKLNDVPVTVVGVNPDSFTGAGNAQMSPDVFVPMSMQPLVSPHSGPRGSSLLGEPELWWVNVMGRIRPGVSDATANAALDVQLAGIVRATMPVRPFEDLPKMDMRDGSRGLFETEAEFGQPMAVLLTMVGFVLLLACANIANLMLARGTQRQREMAIRLSLGAGRIRLARQMLVESLMLAGLGGAGGLVVGYAGSHLIAQLTENPWETAQFQVSFDWGVFGFTAVLTILTGLVFGLAPAISAARAKLNHSLKESAASVTRSRKGWGGKSLVGFQIALSTLLVVGSGLFLRTLASLNAVDAGFRTDHLLLAEVEPPPRIYPAGKDVELHQRLEAAFAAIPGVEAVAPAKMAYIADYRNRRDFLPEDEPSNKGEGDVEFYNVVGNSFFSTLGIPIVAGRAFGPQDTQSSGKVGIINASLARKRFPNQNPVGKRFSLSGQNVDGHGGKIAESWIQIVGVCADTRYSSLRDEPPPQFFLPYVQQEEVGGMVYEIRTGLAAESLAPALSRTVQKADPDLPVVNIRTQEQQIAEATQRERILVALTSSFGVLALALASVGIYGVMAYSVANRTNEIGIRLALGALPRQVLGMVLREATWISLAGIAVGLGAALALARLVKSMLYGLQPADPVSLVAGAVLLIAVGLAASWLPARRAARIEPVEALRHE